MTIKYIHGALCRFCVACRQFKGLQGSHRSPFTCRDCVALGK